MTQAKRETTDYFRMMLLTVVGQAFEAAGYQLESSPVKQAGGLFRFHRLLDDGLHAFIEFQLLYLPSSEWSGDIRSRFRVSLVRSDMPNASQRSSHPRYQRLTLSALVVREFNVPILPSADHWWQFTNTDELGKALAEAGHLAVGYGMPYLAGDLEPPADR